MAFSFSGGLSDQHVVTWQSHHGMVDRGTEILLRTRSIKPKHGVEPATSNPMILIPTAPVIIPDDSYSAQEEALTAVAKDCSSWFLFPNCRTGRFGVGRACWGGRRLPRRTHRYPFESTTNQGGQRCV